jgi:hypothetical protein
MLAIILGSYAKRSAIRRSGGLAFQMLIDAAEDRGPILYAKWVSFGRSIATSSAFSIPIARTIIGAGASWHAFGDSHRRSFL